MLISGSILFSFFLLLNRSRSEPTQSPAATNIELPPPIDDIIPASDKSQEYAVFCQYDNRLGYRSTERDLYSHEVVFKYCTDILIGFWSVDPSTLVIKDTNNQNRETKKHLNDIKFKNRFKFSRIHLSLGDPDSRNEMFEPIFEADKGIDRFVDLAVDTLIDAGFGGLNIVWEATPNDWKSDQLINLCSTLREIFRQRETAHTKRLLLSITVSAFPAMSYYSYGDNLYHLSKYVDYIIVKAFDFYMDTMPVLMHNSPLYIRDVDRDNIHFSHFAVAESMHRWEFRGVRNSKLIMGIPTFGRTVRMTDKNISEPAQEATGIYGAPGNFTGEPGLLSYFEICEIISKYNWSVEWEEKWQAPYAFGPRGDHFEWVGYIDERSMEPRCLFIRRNKYAGAMIWSVDHDDFKYNFCGYDRYPLAHSIFTCLNTKRRRVRKLKSQIEVPSVDWFLLTGFLWFSVLWLFLIYWKKYIRDRHNEDDIW